MTEPLFKMVDGVSIEMSADEAAAIRAEWAANATPPVPQSITPLQARKALRAANLKERVDGLLATAPEEVREEWEYATEIERNHPTLLSLAAALPLTEQQLDELFIAAKAL